MLMTSNSLGTRVVAHVITGARPFVVPRLASVVVVVILFFLQSRCRNSTISQRHELPRRKQKAGGSHVPCFDGSQQGLIPRRLDPSRLSINKAQL
jgi:hypothetical protein